MTQASQPDTDSSTHTPLPWMRNGQTVNDWWRIDGSSERVGLDFLTSPAAIVPDNADADLIVRAVNNHDKLLAMLERVLTTTLEIDRTLGHGHFNPGTLQKMADVIKEAQS